MLRLLLADFLHVLRQIGIDSTTLTGLGWPVAALLYLRLRVERTRRRGVQIGPSARSASLGRSGPREGGEPDRG